MALGLEGPGILKYISETLAVWPLSSGCSPFFLHVHDPHPGLLPQRPLPQDKCTPLCSHLQLTSASQMGPATLITGLPMGFLTLPRTFFLLSLAPSRLTHCGTTLSSECRRCVCWAHSHPSLQCSGWPSRHTALGSRKEQM